MSTIININIGGEETSVRRGGTEALSLVDTSESAAQLAIRELRDMMGDQLAPFPGAAVDAFMSHFVITLQFLLGDKKGQLISLTMPTAVQTVSRSAPFVYRGVGTNHSVKVPLPKGCTLPDEIRETDFRVRPNEYFQIGKETVWMQILNLDAQMDTGVGPIRIILGETLKREYPDVFEPSHGVATSLGTSGFPARLFFNPVALIETTFGIFRAVHGTLSYGRITQFPPVGTPVTIQDQVPMEAVEDVRKLARKLDTVAAPAARILALSHPIDMPLHLSGDEAFEMIESEIRRKSGKR